MNPNHSDHVGDPSPRWKVALVFGGPSAERNISIGSLKPWVVELDYDPAVALTVYFVDRDLQWWVLPRDFYYANTCEDFESQLAQHHQRVEHVPSELAARGFDVVVPLVHGSYGEDGRLAALLESVGVPYLFSTPPAMERTLDKVSCYQHLRAAGFAVPQFATDPDALGGSGPVVVKPRRGGSSIGVVLAGEDPGALADAIATARAESGDDSLVFERLIRGTEFSCVVIEGPDGRPVALAPTQILPAGGLPYDTRQKFLHGSGTRLRTPWPADGVEPIRSTVSRAFEVLGLRHMARIDGFVTADGILVTDVNGIAGTGCSAFTFIQAAVAGLDHSHLIRRLLRGVCPDFPQTVARTERVVRTAVLLGGPTSERHVSRQSGFFVGLCLAAAGHQVDYVLLDRHQRCRRIGLFWALHHDVDEIEEMLADPVARAEAQAMGARLRAELGTGDRGASFLDAGAAVGFDDLFGSEPAGGAAPFVFVALHGGPGEDGTVQAALDALEIAYNGSGPSASAVCADKFEAGRAVRAAALPGVDVVPQYSVARAEFAAPADELFARLRTAVGGDDALVVKPRSDGCSTGVFIVRDVEQFAAVASGIVAGVAELRLSPDAEPVVMPDPPPAQWLAERALVDEVPVPAGVRNRDALRQWIEAKRFVEITVGLIDRGAGLEAMEPAITVAKRDVLSLAEKFQQGGGENILLSDFGVDPATVASLRSRTTAIAAALGIEGYARIDCFWDAREDVLFFLEANTLCGLTEATVFYSEALASFGLSPVEALELIVDHGRRLRERVALR